MSTLHVENLKGLSSGANANTIVIPSGQTLDVSAGTLVGGGSGGGVSTDQILQVQHNTFTTSTTHSTIQTYVDIAGSDITLTAKGDNSTFLLIGNMLAYMTTAVSGANLGFKRNSTQVLGSGGTAGDSWFGFGNGSNLGSSSMNITRTFNDSPAISTGTSITYKMMCGIWNQGTLYVNYAGYGNKSHFTIMEIAQ